MRRVIRYQLLLHLIEPFWRTHQQSDGVVVDVVIAPSEHSVVIPIPDGIVHQLEAGVAKLFCVVASGCDIVGSEKTGCIGKESGVAVANIAGDEPVERVVGHGSPDIVKSEAVVPFQSVGECGV